MAAQRPLKPFVPVRVRAPQLPAYIAIGLQNWSFRPGRVRTYVLQMPWQPPFSETDARAAIARSVCWADALRFLGYPVKGANYRTLQRWAARWGIGTDHFDPNAGRRRAGRTQQIPLDEVLVENSTYNRFNLKRRLLEPGFCNRAVSCAARTSGGMVGGCRSYSITSTASRTTTGSKTFGWCAPTAPRRLTRTVAATCLETGSAPAAGRSSYLGTSATGIAP